MKPSVFKPTNMQRVEVLNCFITVEKILCRHYLMHFVARYLTNRFLARLTEPSNLFPSLFTLRFAKVPGLFYNY